MPELLREPGRRAAGDGVACRVAGAARGTGFSVDLGTEHIDTSSPQAATNAELVPRPLPAVRFDLQGEEDRPTLDRDVIGQAGAIFAHRLPAASTAPEAG